MAKYRVIVEPVAGKIFGLFIDVGDAEEVCGLLNEATVEGRFEVRPVESVLPLVLEICRQDA